MLTKALVAIVMTGALYVAADAAHQNIELPSWSPGFCPLSWVCHGHSETEAKSSGCCSTGDDCCVPPTDCCSGTTRETKSTAPSCCSESK